MKAPTADYKGDVRNDKNLEMLLKGGRARKRESAQCAGTLRQRISRKLAVFISVRVDGTSRKKIALMVEAIP